MLYLPLENYFAGKSSLGSCASTGGASGRPHPQTLTTVIKNYFYFLFMVALTQCSDNIAKAGSRLLDLRLLWWWWMCGCRVRSRPRRPPRLSPRPLRCRTTLPARLSLRRKVLYLFILPLIRTAYCYLIYNNVTSYTGRRRIKSRAIIIRKNIA